MFRISTLLGSAALALAAAGNASAASYLGIEFPQGAISFADAVVSYQPGLVKSPTASPDGMDPYPAWRDANNALGAPDQMTPGLKCTATTGCAFVSLGMGGSLIVKFTDNLLVGSGTSAPDLWIFEGGPATRGVAEKTNVHISSDGQNWISVGSAAGGSAGVDIDPYLTRPGMTFSYVKLTDALTNKPGSTGFNLGADIDAIGAISTMAVPEPATWAMMIAGFGMAGAMLRQRRRAFA